MPFAERKRATIKLGSLIALVGAWGLSGCSLSVRHATSSSSALTTGLNLEVPIEMVDLGLASNTSQTTYIRTQIPLDTTAYDGTVTYYFEIVAQNTNATNAYNVSLVDITDPGTPKVSISVPANTTSPTRFPASLSSAQFAPTSGLANYEVQIDATGATNDVIVYAARIRVQQSGATKTRIYVPLVAGEYTTDYSLYDNNNACNDTHGLVNPSTSAYTIIGNTPFWKKDDSRFATLASGTPFTLEGLICSTAGSIGSAALFDNTTGSEITDSAYSMPSASTGLTTNNTFSVNFSDTATNFTDTDDMQLELANDQGGGCNPNCYTFVGRVGLWINLTSLSKGEVYYRISKNLSDGSATNTYELALIDPTVFSNPLEYFESTVTGAGAATSLYDDGSNDSGSAGASLITTLTGTSTKTLYRSSAVSLTAGDRYFIENSGNPYVRNAYVVVGFSQ